MKNRRHIHGVDSHAQKETAHTPEGEGRQQNAPLNDTPPPVSGQCAEALELLRNVALYSLGVPSWPAPGFLSDAGRQAGFLLPDASLLAALLLLAVAALLLIGGAA